jgi:niacin transporter
MRNYSILRLTVSGLLIAIGIVIPMVSPFKIVLEPASFTLASHVAIFIAMFISPRMAVTVAIGTAIGFLLGGFPIVIVLRAGSHILFAILGALYLQKMQKTKISSITTLWGFSFFIALIHAICELIVVSIFYFGGIMGVAYYQHGFLMSVLLLVGLGTVIHSMIDFKIAHIVVLALQNQTNFEKLRGR